MGIAITFLTNDDDEVMYVSNTSELCAFSYLFYCRYDLKQGMCCLTVIRVKLTKKKKEISKSPVSKVPVELAKHEAAQHRVSREMKRKREDEGEV